MPTPIPTPTPIPIPTPTPIPISRRWRPTLTVLACSLTALLFTSSRLAAHDFPPTVADGAGLVEVYADDRFFEGPTWHAASGALYFTAFGGDNQQLLRLDRPGVVSVVADRTEGVNGTYLSRSGTILAAQAYGHRVLEYVIPEGGDGVAGTTSRVLLADDSLNQPNDICESVLGDVFFSDPDFAKRERSAVYRLDGDGTAHRVLSDMPVPNGLLTSNDGTRLYVADSHLKHWREYPILRDGSVGPGRVFFDPDVEDRSDPDGMSADREGNLYLTGRGGVWCVDPAGEALGFIPVPEFCSNVTFGGDDGKTLYLTCKGKVYSLRMKVQGAQFGADDPFALGRDSRRQPGVPRGGVTRHVWKSEIFEGTIREYWIYVPAQYDGETPANVMVFQDGHAYVSEYGDFRVPVVLDNLIHRGAIPVTVAILINPGHRPPPGEEGFPENRWRSSNRSVEYDTLDDRYARFLIEEILPEVGSRYRLTDDPDRRAICGISSGGICAFTVAWERPDAFRRVVSHVGSFTNIRGGHVYPALIRKSEKRPIRVFLQAGSADLDNRHGNWWLANLQMESALEFAGYDFKFAGGDGAHNGRHGGAILPETLEWLWR